jgi:hypothetical protein
MVAADRWIHMSASPYSGGATFEKISMNMIWTGELSTCEQSALLLRQQQDVMATGELDIVYLPVWFCYILVHIGFLQNEIYNLADLWEHVIC